jgi:hypothetical protein
MPMRSLGAAAIAMSLLVCRVGRAAEPPMTSDEFALWKDYVDALGDERVQKLKEKDRLPAIARNFKVPEKKLRDAVKKGEQYGEQMGADSEKEARAALVGTPVEGRIKELRYDTSHAHVVAYLTWSVDRPDQVEEEASLVAVRCAKSAPLAKTLSLRIVEVGDRPVFSALISREAALRINESRIADFADTRFIRLFEKVERAP